MSDPMDILYRDKHPLYRTVMRVMRQRTDRYGMTVPGGEKGWIEVGAAIDDVLRDKQDDWDWRAECRREALLKIMSACPPTSLGIDGVKLVTEMFITTDLIENELVDVVAKRILARGGVVNEDPPHGALAEIAIDEKA